MSTTPRRRRCIRARRRAPRARRRRPRRTTSCSAQPLPLALLDDRRLLERSSDAARQPVRPWFADVAHDSRAGRSGSDRLRVRRRTATSRAHATSSRPRSAATTNARSPPPFERLRHGCGMLAVTGGGRRRRCLERRRRSAPRCLTGTSRFGTATRTSFRVLGPTIPSGTRPKLAGGPHGSRRDGAEASVDTRGAEPIATALQYRAEDRARLRRARRHAGAFGERAGCGPCLSSRPARPASSNIPSASAMHTAPAHPSTILRFITDSFYKRSWAPGDSPVPVDNQQELAIQVAREGGRSAPGRPPSVRMRRARAQPRHERREQHGECGQRSEEECRGGKSADKRRKWRGLGRPGRRGNDCRRADQIGRRYARVERRARDDGSTRARRALLGARCVSDSVARRRSGAARECTGGWLRALWCRRQLQKVWGRSCPGDGRRPGARRAGPDRGTAWEG